MSKNYISKNINQSVLIGSSIPAGVEHVKLHQQLKQGDIILTLIPSDKNEALAVAKYCRENKIYLCFSEFLHRGSYDLCWAYRKQISRQSFHSKADIDEIIYQAGPYYYGRICVGEIGGVLYWPKDYTINRKAKNWESLPVCDTHLQAQKAYVEYCKKWLDYERCELGKGPLLNVDSSMTCKYHVMAGIDKLCLEVMPGDPHLMYSAIRGTARAYNKPWGAHIAMQCYGGVNFDRLYEKRWRTSLYYSYITGADFIYPESGHYTYTNVARQKKFEFNSEQMKRIRREIREIWQFSRIHNRPNGPKVAVGVIHGNLEGAPGLWNRYAWGQYSDPKWLEGPAERGWIFVDKFYRKENCFKETVQGDMDFSGNPPYGQYDVVPIEAPLDMLKKYSCLVFLGWNTMTPDIYSKLKNYVKSGGRLIMYLAHLNTQADRAKPLKLYNDGGFSDLFGVKIKGKIDKDVRGIKCMADSSIKSYRFPLWRTNTDPRFMGNMTPAKVELTTAKVICGHSNFYNISPEELASQAILVENSLGKGKAMLVTVCEYPADPALERFTDDLLRVVLQGEQGDIRLLGGDAVRYAVYDARLKGSKRHSIVYLLNTDPDNIAMARLWCKGRLTGHFSIPANDLRLAYMNESLVLLPENKCVDIYSWQSAADKHEIKCFSVCSQKAELHNIGDKTLIVRLNGNSFKVQAGACLKVKINKTVDLKRKEFFSSNFMEEPAVDYKHAALPY